MADIKLRSSLMRPRLYSDATSMRGQVGDSAVQHAGRAVELFSSKAGMAIVFVVGLGSVQQEIKLLALLVGFSLFPVWFRTWKLDGPARIIWITVGIAVINGLALTFLHWLRGDVDPGLALDAIARFMLGVVAFAGAALATSRFSGRAIISTMALGMTIARLMAPESWGANPWKYAFALPVSILVVSLAGRVGGKRWEVVALIALGAMGIVFDHRSFLAIAWLTAIITAFRSGKRGEQPRKYLGAAVGLAALAVSAYLAFFKLMQMGIFGAEIQRRTLMQSGSSPGAFLLGGRPEIAGAFSLVKNDLLGRGFGARPTYEEINGIRESLFGVVGARSVDFHVNYMVQGGFRLHSLVGDLWVNLGIGGLLLIGLLGALTVKFLAKMASGTTAVQGGVMLLGLNSLWNIFFGTLDSGWIPLMVLAGVVAIHQEPVGQPRRMDTSS